MFKETMPQIIENDDENEISYASGKPSPQRKIKRPGSAHSNRSGYKLEGEGPSKSPSKFSQHSASPKFAQTQQQLDETTLT